MLETAIALDNERQQVSKALVVVWLKSAAPNFTTGDLCLSYFKTDVAESTVRGVLHDFPVVVNGNMAAMACWWAFLGSLVSTQSKDFPSW